MGMIIQGTVRQENRTGKAVGSYHEQGDPHSQPWAPRPRSGRVPAPQPEYSSGRPVCSLGRAAFGGDRWRLTRVRTCGLRWRRPDFVHARVVVYLDRDFSFAFDLPFDLHHGLDSDFRLPVDDVPRDRRRLARLSP